MDNKTYCTYFWEHICIRPNQKALPCCRFNPRNIDSPDAKAADETFINSEIFMELRKKSLNGTPIEGCNKCYNLEKAGVYSLRQSANDNASRTFTDLKSSAANIRSVELFLSDVCNLKCVMCNPKISTRWREDYKALGWGIGERPKSIDYTQFLHPLNSLEEVKFIGGEPFLAPQHTDTLRILSTKNPKDIALRYSTNGTVPISDEVIDLWRKFKKVTVHLSVDGIDSLNHYIRYPSSWSKTSEVNKQFFEIKKILNNFEIQVSSTVCIYNIFSIKSIEDWFKKMQSSSSESPFVGLNFVPLITPPFLSCLNLPEEIKNIAINNLDEASHLQNGIKKYLLNRTVEFDHEVITYTKKLDKLRGLDVKTIVPELSPLFN